MLIGIDCRCKRDENGELWVRCAPVIKDADKHQRTKAAGLIIGIISMITLMVIGMCATDLPHENIIDVTPKYGVMP